MDAASADAYVKTVAAIAEQLPYDSGYASPALTYGTDSQMPYFTEAARKWAFRHPGFDMCSNDATNTGIGRLVRGAHWLTFLGPWASKELGGEAGLRKKLPKDIEVQTVGGGVMLRAGKVPEVGDVNKSQKLPLLRAMAKVLEPVTLFDDTFLSSIFVDMDEVSRWERRHLASRRHADASAYRLPFAFDVAQDNPWDGRRPVELAVHAKAPLGAAEMQTLQDTLAPFWALADVGGLAGTAIAPWALVAGGAQAGAGQPAGRRAREFPIPARAEEKASACLASLLLVVHRDVPLVRARPVRARQQDAAGDRRRRFGRPYPGLWQQLPFAHVIEDSEESFDMELRGRFAKPLTDDQVTAVHAELMKWAAAAEGGAFGIADVEPWLCGCDPVNPLEHDRGDIDLVRGEVPVRRGGQALAGRRLRDHPPPHRPGR